MDERMTVLRDPRFLRLWAGTTLSGLATWALPFLLGLGVLDGSLTAVDLGLALAARTAGFLAAVPAAGVLADRWSRRAVAGWASGLAGVASLVAAAALGTAPVLLVVASTLVGAGQGACRPAFQALVAEVVDPAQRQSANAAVTIAVRVTVLVAPALSALAALALEVPVLVAVSGVLWLAAAAVPPRGTARPAREGRPNVVREFADGLTEARRHPWSLAGLGALTAVIATGYSVTAVALPLVARDRYGSEVVLAAAATAYTLGALAGALITTRWRPAAPGWVALAGLAVYAVAPLALLLPVPAAVVVVAYVLTGIGIELVNVPWFTAPQRVVECQRRARKPSGPAVSISPGGSGRDVNSFSCPSRDRRWRRRAAREGCRRGRRAGPSPRSCG